MIKALQKILPGIDKYERVEISYFQLETNVLNAYEWRGYVYDDHRKTSCRLILKP